VGWLISNMMHTSLEEKIEQKLLDVSDSIEREISLWFKERSYDLHVFSNSFIIRENYSAYLDIVQNKTMEKNELPAHTRAIETYLTSLQKQFNEYDSLFLLDTEGRVFASSLNAGQDLGAKLPEDMDRQLQNSQFFCGPVFFNSDKNLPFVVMGTPLFSEKSEQHVGILAIKVALTDIQDLINTHAHSLKKASPIEIMLIHLPDSRYIMSTRTTYTLEKPVFISEDILRSFYSQSTLNYFTKSDGIEMIGVFSPLKIANWGLVLAENADMVFSRVSETRYRNLLILCFLSLVIGIAAYFFARQIIRPLITLTKGAQKVANGDLSIQLPIEKNDELGFATNVFNTMVAELNQNQAKLERMATQDVLTKLSNRKQILQTLHSRFEYYQRYKNPFSVLMIDVDHFKNVNDTHGHMAGDMVLSTIGQIFKDTLRSVDSAGRYGGEEFLVILTDSDKDDARHVAERIRLTIANHTFSYEKRKIPVTVSIGIAKTSIYDRDETSLVNRADQALYAAKNNGRNRVFYLEEKGGLQQKK
jgi:diguanylate cyclase (GGDEF)-like protein